MSNRKIPPPPTMPPSIQLSKSICLFHKGPLSSERYTCPTCKTQYCVNCAKKAKSEKKTCLKCKQLIFI
ncbi:MAG: hypothetical protein ACTSR8_09435 [Promethearchaeota archaeon]